MEHLFFNPIACYVVIDWEGVLWYYDYTEDIGDEAMADTEIHLTEEKMKELNPIVQQLRLIDDIFFEKVMEDRETCEEVIRVIMESPELCIKEVHPQEPVHNLQGRSVRLDALCERTDGSFINVEVQRADNDNHFKRVRYNASCITANVTDPGEKFKNVRDVCIIYISEFDVFKKGKTIYHTRQVVQETEKDVKPVYVEDGFSSIYVNTEIKDNTEISELMDCFLQTKVNNPKFPKLSSRVAQFKENEEGERKMNALLEKYVEKSKMEGINEGIKEGMEIGRAREIIRLSRRYNISDNDIQEELRNALQISQEAAKRYIEKYKETN